ncbi:hypothetical protein [Okeania sp. SIO1I7]|nr:hypothetical protein [Okeania sp. SIO1I7]
MRESSGVRREKQGRTGEIFFITNYPDMILQINPEDFYKLL